MKTIEQTKRTHWDDLKDILCEEIDFERYLRILWVDDDNLDIAHAKRFLTKKDVFIDDANSALEALEKIKCRRYEMMVIDYQMPIMTGLELLREIQAVKSIKVLFTGMILTADEIDDIKELGGYYIEKTQIGSLMLMIDQMIEDFKKSRKV